jgi:transposase-like protein
LRLHARGVTLKVMCTLARALPCIAVTVLVWSLGVPSVAHGRQPSIASYGPISVGRPNAGFLVNGKRLRESKDWTLTAPDHAYATAETIEQLSHCITRVRKENPGAPRVHVGSLSARGGGKITPHESHRSGRDADIFFFRSATADWTEPATSVDLDVPRTWALLRCFITDTDVDFVFIDQAVQGWLEAYALEQGEPAEWVSSLFHDQPAEGRRPAQLAVVHHAPGHQNHMHVRFVSPKARRLGVALFDRLVREGYVKPARAGIEHTVAQGETLSSIARRYHVTAESLRRRNALTSKRLQPGQELSIVPAVVLAGAKEAVQIPTRRRPPASSSTALHARADCDSGGACAGGQVQATGTVLP